MPDPPWPLPTPGLSPPAGDMAREPAPAPPGMPAFEPGWLETTMPVPAAFPPVLLGGAATEPVSSGPPKPLPRLPRPNPEAVAIPETDGGGGTAADPPPSPTELPLCKEPPPTCTGGGTALGMPNPEILDCPAGLPVTWTGGATTFGFSRLAIVDRPVGAPFNCTGGGTTFGLPKPENVRRSDEALPT